MRHDRNTRAIPALSRSDPSHAETQELETIRTQLKAARLEKLLAEQLASEFHIDETDISEVAITTEPANTQRYHEPHMIVGNAHESDGADTHFPHEAEQSLIIVKQQKLIELLEQLRNRDLKQINALKTKLAQQSDAVETDNNSAVPSHSHSNDLYKSVHRLSEELARTTQELITLQGKYAELNEHHLELQNKLFARVNAVDDRLQDARKEVASLSRYRLELVNELDASESLLNLHKKMKKALSGGKPDEAA